MLKVHSEPPKPELKQEGPVILALGFRPFFMSAALSALILMLIWLGAWSGAYPLPAYYGGIGWHSHEMLFGYAVAIIAGFLLTAVRNWTGVTPPTGTPLGLLFLLWLAGRVAPFLSGVIPPALIAIIDLAFLPAVALAIMPALWKGEQKVNRVFVPLLLVMAVANLYVHLQSLGLTNTAIRGADAMLYLVAFLITLLGGRVIPFFTEAVIPGHSSKRNSRVELATVISLGGLIAVQFVYPNALLSSILAFAVAVTQILRVTGWYNRQIWQIPILWVLFTGMFWLVIGFTMTGLAYLGFTGLNLAKHAITVGGIGVLTYGMMARVALGHTGREIQSNPLINGCFILLNLAALFRVFGPVLLPGQYTMWVHLSGGIWIISFLLFAVIYVPMLTQPRVDGKPG
ncbi:NnrS family protein [Sedimenticola sp.]|uniref:NnrS family protein n=1 Tax=Sedimenticola sp. TaxID=1940285 RepID=UPI00258CA666|nr:NnrS family protein [Sedimenticola sp.]MCW8902823.1 NnrS family protein [Sedimenticola sp.]